MSRSTLSHLAAEILKELNYSVGLCQVDTTGASRRTGLLTIRPQRINPNLFATWHFQVQIGMSAYYFLNYPAALAAKWAVFESDGHVLLALVDLGGIVRWLMMLLLHDAPFTYSRKLCRQETD